MASNINPYNVDGTFPVAGQDNSSQGFRDNFTSIKNNFLFAENEITDLQSKVLVTSALNGQTISNDMAGTQLIRPQLAAWTQSLLDNGAVLGPITLNFNQANFQKITTAGPVSLNFSSWPTSTGTGALGYGIMRVWINITNTAHTVTLPSSVNIADDSLSNYNGNGLMTFDNVGDYIFDFSSIDGGNSFIVQDLTRNRAQFTDSNFYYNIERSASMYIGFGGGSLNGNSTAVTGYFPLGIPTIQSYDDGDDMVITFGSVNSYSVGNLSLATISNNVIDTGGVAGYTVSSGRGNILVGTIQPVQSNDILGYVNGSAFTGNGTPGTGNTFQQTASIGFYATGANLLYGLGGNIGFFTSKDGQAGTVTQAVGVENDQSVKHFGNLITSNVYVPTHANSGGATGQISFDSSHIYVCLGPNNWMRANIAGGW